MKKIISFLTMMLLSLPAFAMNQLLVGGTGSTTVSTSVNNYMSIMNYDRSAVAAANEGLIEQISALPGVMSNLNVRIVTAPGSAKSYVFTLRQNGADTALTCTITGAAATTCADINHTINISAGDLLDISIAPSGTPGGAAPQTNVNFNTQNPNATASNINSIYSYTSVGLTASTSAVNYTSISGVNGVLATTEANVKFIMPVDGNFSNLRAVQATAPGGSASYKYTFRVNGLDTTLTATISASGTSANDLVDSISVKAGDLVDISITPTSTPTASTFTLGVAFASSKGYNFIYFGNSTATALSTSVADYMSFSGVNGSVSTTPGTAVVSGRMQLPFYVNAFYAYHVTAPGGGTSYADSFYNSSSTTATSVTCTVSGTANSCSYLTPGFVGTPANSYAISFVPTSTPTASIVSSSLLVSEVANGSINPTLGGY